MKKMGLLLGGLVFTFMLSGAGSLFAGDMKGMEGHMGPAGMPAADAAALWSYIHSTSPYWNWAQWPGKSGLYAGTEPHGMLLQTFVNEIAQRGIYDKTGSVDNHGIVVKENYKPDKTLAAITVMYKVKGYNPEAGDWFWVKYAPDGTALKEGKPAGCIGCHGAKKENDYFMTGPIQ